MKVAIYSSYAWVCKVNNYGSLFQYYALQSFIKELGYEVEWIRMSKKTSKKNLFKHHNLDSFKDFISKYLTLSNKEYHSYCQIIKNPPIADIYITGSDQVWSGISPERYLLFGPFSALRLSYAASFSKTSLSKKAKMLCYLFLRNMDHISVRESSGIDVCKSVKIKDAVHVLDPTFLLSQVQWNKISSNTQYPKEFGYLYFVNPIESKESLFYSDIAAFLCGKNLDTKITPIQGAEYTFTEHVVQPSPDEWLSLMNCAKYIFTNSFHGVAFSIIMRKQFLVLPQKNKTKEQNCRFLDLLEKFGLKDRLYDSSLSIKEAIEKPIEWEKINPRIEDFVDFSKSWLVKSLKK